MTSGHAFTSNMAHSKLKELKELRKSGKTRASTYQIDDDDEPVYTTMDAIEYEKLQQKRILEDDFVVDDDGSGYVEDGNDSWERYENEEPRQTKRVKKNNRKPASMSPTGPRDGNLTALFNRTRPVPTKTPARKVESGDVDDLIASLGAKKKVTRAPITPQTPTPFRAPRQFVRPPAISEALKPRYIAPLDEAEPDIADEQGDHHDMDIDGPNTHTEPRSETLELPNSDAPVPSVSDAEDDLMTPKRDLSNTESSLLTPDQSSEIGFEEYSYEQNVITDSKAQTPNVSIDSIDLASTGELDFYYNDFCETDQSIMLFGRVGESKANASVCVIVQNLYRELFFLPSQNCTTKDVEREIIPLLQTMSRSVRSSSVTKKYCFGLEKIPHEAEYLRVEIGFDAHSQKLQGLTGKSFQHVFGATATIFERFSLISNVKGPGWLKAKSLRAVGNSTSSCHMSFVVDCNDISVANDCKETAPPLKIMSLSLRTCINPKTKDQEVVCISARIFKNVPLDVRTPTSELPSILYTAVRPASGESVFPLHFKKKLKDEVSQTKLEVTCHNSEKHLLNWFVDIMQNEDPDAIIGHGLENLHFGVLFSRFSKLDVAKWWAMGRRGPVSRRPTRVDRFALSQWLPGRLYCDLSNEMGRSMTTKCDSYTLSEMSLLYLGKSRPDIEMDIARSPYDSEKAEGLMKILRQNEHDTLLIASLVFKIQILSLTKVLTNLAGNSWQRTLSGSRVDRNEFILLHEFTSQGYIVPDRQFKDKSTPGRKNAAYEGGMVLEPDKGLHDKIVLVMDFNSLYPSIIQEFNICFTTVTPKAPTEGDEAPEPDAPDSSVSMGIFPRLIRSLVERRREVKKAMKNCTEAERDQFDIRQQALKLTANSMYGCLAYDQSRFYAIHLAKLTTSKGRQTLAATKNLAENNGLKVVYGDTDSVMINTNATDYYEALRIGSSFREKVNSQYKMLEIGIDNVYSKLLLNAKKKYAAVNVTKVGDELKSSIEVKGFDLKRREYCPLSKEASLKALDFIFYSKDLDEAFDSLYGYLEGLAKQARSNEIKLSKFAILTRLGKDLDKYSETDRKSHIHVSLALRKVKAGEVVKQGDTMSYILTVPEKTGAAEAERAFTLKEVTTNNLTPDYEYYLQRQIYDPIDRICTNIDGYDAARLAQALGIKVKHKVVIPSRSYGLPETSLPDSRRFQDCKPLELVCECKHKFEFRGVENLSANGIQCPMCNRAVEGFRLHSQLERQIVASIKKYYEGWTICEECKHMTRQLSVVGPTCLSQNGSKCSGTVKFSYDSRQLYSQLSYYSSMFDMSRETKDDKHKILMGQNSTRFLKAHSLVDYYLRNSGRRYVDMKSLFAM